MIPFLLTAKYQSDKTDKTLPETEMALQDTYETGFRQYCQSVSTPEIHPIRHGRSIVNQRVTRTGYFVSPGEASHDRR